MDGYITKTACGGEIAARSPIERGKQGRKRSVDGEGGKIALHLVTAQAGDHDAPLPKPTLAGVIDMIGPNSSAAMTINCRTL